MRAQAAWHALTRPVEEIFESTYKADFEKAGLWYEHRFVTLRTPILTPRAQLDRRYGRSGAATNRALD